MGLTGPAASVETVLAIYTYSSPKSPSHQAQKLAYLTVWQPRFPAVISSRNGSVPAHPRARGVREAPRESRAAAGTGDADSAASSAESKGNHTRTVERGLAEPVLR